jgi:hypothetical protein
MRRHSLFLGLRQQLFGQSCWKIQARSSLRQNLGYAGRRARGDVFLIDLGEAAIRKARSGESYRQKARFLGT